jgi:hypothetical protein
LFLPVTAVQSEAEPRVPDEAAHHPGRRIEIELADGCRVRVDDGVSLTALRRVLTALRG